MEHDVCTQVSYSGWTTFQHMTVPATTSSQNTGDCNFPRLTDPQVQSSIPHAHGIVFAALQLTLEEAG